MIQQTKLEDLIREKIPLGSADSRGFYSLKCPCCSDYKIRAGWKFEDEKIVFNCWNCSTSSVYEEFGGHISKKMRGILNAFDIDDTEISSVVNLAFFNKKAESKVITLADLKKINTTTPTISLPPKSYPLGHPEFIDYQSKIVDYLIDRNVDFIKYPFYFSLEERFINRVIIPFYRNNNLIYWQARSIIESEKKRYDNAQVSREAVMFNLDYLHFYSQGPLFVTEGVFDAMMVDGIALLGSKLTEAKVNLLLKSPRRLVFVIDKDSNGRHLAEDVLRRGWEIAFAPYGADDLNHSVKRFGMSWTIMGLMQSIPKDFDAARLMINLNCK